MKTFKRQFADVIKQQIDYYLMHYQLNDISNDKVVLYNEVLEHSIQCKMLNKSYYPRKDILDRVKSSSL
jgi:hypothetical protein